MNEQLKDPKHWKMILNTSHQRILENIKTGDLVVSDWKYTPSCHKGNAEPDGWYTTYIPVSEKKRTRRKKS